MVHSTDLTTQEELDAELAKVRIPAPIIWVGPDCPIDHWLGWGNPYPGYYKGAQVLVNPRMDDRAFVEQLAQI